MNATTERAGARVPFRDWVKERRERLGFRTQAALADAMSQAGDRAVDANYVWQLENGRVNVPQQPFLRQLARALGVSEIDVLVATGLITERPAVSGSDRAPYHAERLDALLVQLAGVVTQIATEVQHQPGGDTAVRAMWQRMGRSDKQEGT